MGGCHRGLIINNVKPHNQPCLHSCRLHYHMYVCATLSNGVTYSHVQVVQVSNWAAVSTTLVILYTTLCIKTVKDIDQINPKTGNDMGVYRQL